MAYRLAKRPKGLPILGDLPYFARNPLGFLEHRSTLGDMVPMRLLNFKGYVVNHPDLIEQVLVGTERAFAKDPPGRKSARDAGAMIFGNGLLTSSGDFWRRQRRLAQPAFHRERIDAYGATMVDHTLRGIAGWREGETRDIHRDMMAITLEIVAKTLFNAELSGEVAMIGHAMDALMDRMQQDQGGISIPLWLPIASNRCFKQAIHNLDGLVYRLIAQRRAEGVDRGDLLSMLLAARDEDGQGMTVQQLRDELLTFFLAGHETTALSLSWTFYLLSQNPEARKPLEAELDQVLEGRSPTLADLPRLRYTDQVLKESMRLYPPAWFLGRFAAQDVELGGVQVNQGEILFLSQWTMHRDGRYFAEPSRYRPERWTEEFAKALPRYAYFPFGGGSRLCIGASFAQIEAALLLATIAQRYRLTLEPGHRVVPQTSITIRPKYGLRMQVSAR